MKKIYIWSFIILAGIILLVLYTPMGGRWYYAGDKISYNIQPGVNFQQNIMNSPGFSSSAGGEARSFGAQPYVGASAIARAAANMPANANMATGAVSGGWQQTDPTYNSYVTTADGSGMMSTAARKNRGDYAAGGFAPMPVQGNMTRISESLGLPDNQKQDPNKTGGSAFGDGATDPGTDPAANSMIPVGGNELILALFATVYLIVKLIFPHKKD